MRKQAMTTVLAVCLLALGCAGRNKPEHAPEPAQVALRINSPTTFDVITQPKSVAELMAGKDGIVAVTLFDDRVEPPELTAHAGHPVRLHIVNRGTRPHNFIMAALGVVGRALQPGEENFIEFTPGRPGAFTFVSDAHGTLSWRGSLVVEAQQAKTTAGVAGAGGTK